MSGLEDLDQKETGSAWYRTDVWSYAFNSDVEAACFRIAICEFDGDAQREGNSVGTVLAPDITGPIWQACMTADQRLGGYAAHLNPDLEQGTHPDMIGDVEYTGAS